MRRRLTDFSATVKHLGREEELWQIAWRQGWSLVRPARAAVLVNIGGRLVPALDAISSDDPVADERLLEGSGVSPPGRRLPSSEGEGKEFFEFEVPVTGKEGLLGCCRLGPKKAGGPYSVDEVNFLNGIAGQCALAIDRARLLEQGRKRERLAALGKAAAVVSHELRNPLSVMRGATALLRTRITIKEGLPLLAVVEKEISRGDRFISDFLSACREPRPHFNRLDVCSSLREFAATWPASNFPHLHIRLDLPPGALPVRADAFQLSRVFRNLARNAAESARGDVLLSMRAEQCGRAEVLVTASDNGPGIDEHTLSRVFEPFHTTRRNGTGLGLAITKSIIDAHGGRMGAGNGPEGGAVFRIWLPFLGASAGENVETMMPTRGNGEGGEE